LIAAKGSNFCLEGVENLFSKAVQTKIAKMQCIFKQSKSACKATPRGTTQLSLIKPRTKTSTRPKGGF